jgi:Lhr-like helicase
MEHGVRIDIEDRLTKGELKVGVATSALAIAIKGTGPVT